MKELSRAVVIAGFKVGALLAGALWIGSGPAVAQTYTHSAVASVGYVQASGARGGVTVWKQKGNTPFPACTADPSQMWISSAVTEQSTNAMLAILLTAKSLDQSVTVYYVVEASGYCSMTHVGIN